MSQASQHFRTCHSGISNIIRLFAYCRDLSYKIAFVILIIAVISMVQYFIGKSAHTALYETNTKPQMYILHTHTHTQAGAEGIKWFSSSPLSHPRAPFLLAVTSFFPTVTPLSQFARERMDSLSCTDQSSNGRRVRTWRCFQLACRGFTNAKRKRPRLSACRKLSSSRLLPGRLVMSFCFP